MEKKKVFTGFIWRFAERCGAQGVSLVVSIILARLLSPDVYGMIALVSVFTSILQVFIDGGMGSALIQKKDADDLDFSTIFYFNMAACILLYLGLFAAAPLIADFYKNPELTAVMRVLRLTLIVSGVKNVQQAYVSRNMIFKRFFFATLGGTIGAAIIGIGMAYAGFGVWALVMQQLFNVTMDTAILWLTVKWRPKKTFSTERLKGLFNYGWKLLASGLLEALYGNLRQLIIGKLYSPDDLAFYNRGDKFPNMIANNINTSIDSVLLPAMSNEQDDRERVRAMTRRSIKTSVYVMAPLMMGMCFTAEPLIRFLLTEKWLPCVPFLRICCVSYMFHPIHTANLNAIKALGRSDIFLKLEIVKKAVGILALLISMWFGVLAMAYSLLPVNIICQLINSWPNRKLLGYKYSDQLKDILPSILLALVMGAVVSLAAMIDAADWVILLIQVISGGVIYIAGSAILRFDSFKYFWKLVKDKGGLKRNRT